MPPKKSIDINLRKKIQDRVHTYNSCISRTNPPYLAFQYVIDLSEENGELIGKTPHTILQGDHAIQDYLDQIAKLDPECG